MLDLGALSVRILADSSSAVATMTSFQNTVDNTSNSINSSITNLGNSLTSIGTNMTTKVTLPLVGVAAAVTKIGADYEAQMSSVQAISGATGSDLEKLKEKAREIGATTALSSKQAAEGLEYMALAGWKTTEMLEGYDGIVNLALSSNMDLGRASDIVTDYLTAFGLAASDAGHFADTMAYAMSNSNTTTAMLGEAYKNCAATANSFGVSMEEATAWLGKMADAGVKGGEAGTTLNAVLARMYGETKTTNDALMEYGLTMYDAEGKAKGFTQVMSEIEKAMKGMTEQQQNVFLKAVAGTNQLSGFATMIKAGTDNVIDFTEALRDSDGTATEMAEIMTDNLSGSIEILVSNLEETGIQLYEMKDGSIKSFVDGLDDMITSFQNLDDDTKNTIITLAAVAAAIGPVTLAIGTTVKSVGALGSAFSALVSNPIIAGVTALSVAIGYVGIKTLEAKVQQSEWNEKMQEAIKMANDFTYATDDQTKTLQDSVGVLGEEINYIDNYSNSISNAGDRLSELEEQMISIDITTEEGIEAYQEMEREYKALSESIRNGNVNLADNKSAIAEHIEALKDEYGSIENAKTIYKLYNDRLDNIANAKKIVEGCTDDHIKTMAKEALQLQTNSSQSSILYQNYLKLSSAEKDNTTQSKELVGVCKELKSQLGEEVAYIDANTGRWVVNTSALMNEISANDNLSSAKLEACRVMNKNDAKLTEATIENCRTRIIMYQREAEALAGSGDVEDINEVTRKISYYSVLASTLEYLTAKTEEFGEELEETGEKGEKAGGKTSKTAKDALQAWQEMYTQKKKLGEIDLNEQERMLDEMKAKYSDSADHIISANEFAQAEILDIIQQRKEQETITVDEEIALYELAKEKYCTNAADRKAFEDEIIQAIQDSVRNMTDDIADMDVERLDDLKTTLTEMKDKYDEYSYDIEFIEETITEVTKEEYKKRKEELDDTLDDMRKAIDEFYGKQEEEMDAESKSRQDKLQAEINELEAQQAEKERIEKEAKLLKAVADAEDEESRKEAQSRYDDWLIEQKKKSLKEQLQAEKDDLDERKLLLEDQKSNLKEMLDYQYLLEAEKLEVQKNNQNLTDDEIERIAKENLEKRMQEEVDSMSNNLQDLLNNASEYESLGQKQMEYYLRGLESYTDAISSYFDSIIPNTEISSVESSSVKVDGSHKDGLDFVPYDGYIAELHYGERILKKDDAEIYRTQDNTAKQHGENIFDTSELVRGLDKIREEVKYLPRQMLINANMG